MREGRLWSECKMKEGKERGREEERKERKEEKRKEKLIKFRVSKGNEIIKTREGINEMRGEKQ